MDRRVLVTAGASGIGREIARAFAATGDKVFVCDVDANALKDLAKELPAVASGVCDVSKRHDIEHMVPAAIHALGGGLDVLVNNVGISGPTVPTDELDPAEWDKVVQVNLTATFDVTRLCIPHLKESPAGVIINMSSVAGRFGYANRIAYSASKWGVIGFTKTLSIELGSYGIRVNAILPGAVDGPRLQRVFEGRAKLSGQTVEHEAKAIMVNQSVKSLVAPHDIAALAVFLASDAGKSISGQALPIDGDMQSLN
jgi:NAD(P)-dependent dehydrogenase (short-subunit alcohol dehydrogenase family)